MRDKPLAGRRVLLVEDDYFLANDASEAIQQAVGASETLQRYALQLWRATAEPAAFGVRLHGLDAARVMLAGASPRGMSMLLRAARVAAWLDGRGFVTPEDVQAVFVETIAHRLCYQPAYELRRQEVSDQLMAGILAAVSAP